MLGIRQFNPSGFVAAALAALLAAPVHAQSVDPSIYEALRNHPASREAPRPRVKSWSTRLDYDASGTGSWTRYISTMSINNQFEDIDGPIQRSRSQSESRIESNYEGQGLKHSQSRTNTQSESWLGLIELVSSVTMNGEDSFRRLKAVPEISGHLFPLSVGNHMEVRIRTEHSAGFTTEETRNYRITDKLAGATMDSRLGGDVYVVNRESRTTFQYSSGKPDRTSQEDKKSYFSTDLGIFIPSPRHRNADGAWVQSTLLDFERDPGAQAPQPSRSSATSPPPRAAVAAASPAVPTPSPKGVSSGSEGPDPVELTFWDSVKASTDAADFAEYLRQYPKGKFAGLARNRIKTLKENTSSSVAVARSAPGEGTAASKTPALGRYHALVIGNTDYKTLKKLHTPANDAKAVAAMLKDKYGFQVRTLVNASREQIITAFDELRARLVENDNLLVYYAGHGWLDKESERGYWLPVEAREDSRAAWLSNADITDTLKAMRARHVLVVADSCYSGTLVRGLHITERTPDYLERAAAKRARLVMTSGGLEPVQDGSGRHSPFAKAFLAVLDENSGIIDGTSLFHALKRSVMTNAPQTPEYADIRFADHDGGDFLFGAVPPSVEK